MRRAARLQASLLVVVFFVPVFGAFAAAGGADSATSSVLVGTSSNADALRSSLHQARSELSSIQAERAQVTRDRQAVRTRLDVARRNLVGAQRSLAAVVRAAYEHEPADPIAAVLASQSLDDAVTTIDDLSRAGEQAHAIVAQARDTRVQLAVLTSRLAEADARSAALEATARARAESLAQAVAAREQAAASVIADPRAQPTVSPARGNDVAAPAGSKTLTVVATAYSTNGTTASGLPTGWGVVAVDPAVIPLGTRLTVPGYGDAVAADTGGAVQGATLDVWFPTEAAARAWGRRVITVTLH